MQFFIITPSFNQLDYLKRCMASIADQGAAGFVRVHHHVQDGGSTDGTAAWLRVHQAEADAGTWGAHYSFSFASEADDGMYDALNRGLGRMDPPHWRNSPSESTPNVSTAGGIVAWLNCDEQYLPGTLMRVADFFAENPAVDFVYGDTLNVDPAGALLTYRKNPPLRRAYVAADHLYIQSASLFLRARIFERGMRFDTRWRAVSDCDLVCRLLKQGLKAAPLRAYLSVFTMTGQNLSVLAPGRRELTDFRREQAGWIRWMRWPLNVARFVEKALRGGYRHRAPLAYQLYADDLATRCRFTEEKPSSRFRWR